MRDDTNVPPSEEAAHGYEPPELIVIGSIEELTMGTKTGTATDLMEGTSING